MAAVRDKYEGRVLRHAVRRAVHSREQRAEPITIALSLRTLAYTATECMDSRTSRCAYVFVCGSTKNATVELYETRD